jgi:hypothetical protein
MFRRFQLSWPKRAAKANLKIRADNLMREGIGLWVNDPHAIQSGIQLIEEAWALDPTPDKVIQLVIMYDRINRHQDAINILWQGLRLYPTDADIRCYAATTLFRHGDAANCRQFCEFVQLVDPEDLFARFILRVTEFFDEQTQALSSRIDGTGKRPFVIATAVWGERYVDEFVDLACGALLAPDNVPRLSERYAVHLVIFTTAEDEARLRNSTNLGRLAEVARISFHLYPDEMMIARSTLDDRYGVRLGEYYSRMVKFALMSTCHYVALEVGRRTDALVTAMGADNVCSDRALTRMADLVEDGADVVLVCGFRLLKGSVIDVVEQRHRAADGSIRISSDDYVDFLIDGIPRGSFVDADAFADFPLIVCWRIPHEGVLVHANHYHPYCVAAGRLSRPLSPTIDPIDGRFIHRYMPTARLHIVQDTSIAVADLGDEPLVEVQPGGGHAFSERDVGLWLWGVWDSLRAPLFRSPLRLRRGGSTKRWAELEEQASGRIAEILAVTTTYVASDGSRDHGG